MQEQNSDGLQFLFEKNKGVDHLYLYINSRSPLKLSQLKVQTNVYVGTGTPRDLETDTRDWFLATRCTVLPKEVSNDHKITFLKAQIREGFRFGKWPLMPDATVMYNDYFCPWGRLVSKSASREDCGDHFLLTWNYDDPLEIGPYEQVELAYANSFHGLSLRSPIAGVQCLPRIFVQQAVDTTGLKGWSRIVALNNPPPLREIPLEQLILHSEKSGVRVLDRSTVGKARSADLTRRFVGYYANYFMYQRDYFVTDIPVDHVNCISYGMMRDRKSVV